jgi:hypothetical protein
LVFDHPGPEPAAFFGTYVEVKPYSRLAWTNEEGGEGVSTTGSRTGARGREMMFPIASGRPTISR